MGNFFNSSTTNLFSRKTSKKQIKREVLANNRARGKAAEDGAKLNAAMQGVEYERTGRGHDFKAYKTDMLTGKRRFLGYREIKSSKTAPVSKLQKKMHQKMKGKHKIIINNPYSFY